MYMQVLNNRRMRIMLISVASIIVIIAAVKITIGFIINRAISGMRNTPIEVSVTKAEDLPWQPLLSAAGSLRAIRGVNITTELAGMVEKIYFLPGTDVKEGELLVQLNAAAEIGLMHSLEAQVALAEITYNRDKAQYEVRAISKQQLDTDFQNWQSLKGQLAQQIAVVNKKSIRAPFAGRVGVRNINEGQYLNPGDVVTMLQTLHPIWADFYFPQQDLAKLQLQQQVIIKNDAFPQRQFIGKVTTINPGVDTTTRNILVEATIENENLLLKPGMFVSGDIKIGSPVNRLTVPITAMSFNPYGDVVYVVRPTDNEKDATGRPLFIAKQRFVISGEQRGDQIAIIKGLKRGDVVVTSGQIRLKNENKVVINNTISPPASPNPPLPNNH